MAKAREAKKRKLNRNVSADKAKYAHIRDALRFKQGEQRSQDRMRLVLCMLCTAALTSLSEGTPFNIKSELPALAKATFMRIQNLRHVWAAVEDDDDPNRALQAWLDDA